MKHMGRSYPLLTVLTFLVCLASYARASTFTEALEDGSYNGSLGVHYSYQDNDVADQEFGNLFLQLSGETGEVKRLKVGAGVTVLADFLEKNHGDADDAHGELIHLAYIQYKPKDFSLTLGRQEVDLEWVGDYHEAFSFEYSMADTLTFTALATRSIAIAGPDEISDKFEYLRDSNGDKTTGYTLDVKYHALEKHTFNAYFLGIDDLFKGYGIKAELDTETFGATLHFATSDEDDSGLGDGSITHGELRGKTGELALAAGGIVTDNDAGAGSLPSIGDNINPLEDGNYVYEPDATTWYAGAEFALEKLSLAALFADTRYGSSNEREFNVIATYSILENLTTEALLVDVAAEDSSEDYTRVQFFITYSF